jgi:hypothetical protein
MSSEDVAPRHIAVPDTLLDMTNIDLPPSLLLLLLPL